MCDKIIKGLSKLCFLLGINSSNALYLEMLKKEQEIRKSKNYDLLNDLNGASLSFKYCSMVT